MGYEQILYDVSDRIATITLNRPDKLNAWTMRMSAEVRHAAFQADRDDAVRVIIVTGAGKGYCAGADMNMLQGLQRRWRCRRDGGRRRRPARGGRSVRAGRVQGRLQLSARPPQAGHRGGQRRRRRARAVVHALLRHAHRLRPRPLRHGLLAPRLDRRARQRLAAAAPRRHGARVRPALLRPPDRRRRRRCTWGWSTASCRTTTCCRRCATSPPRWRRCARRARSAS